MEAGATKAVCWKAGVERASVVVAIIFWLFLSLAARALKKATRHAGKRWKRGGRALSPPGMERRIRKKKKRSFAGREKRRTWTGKHAASCRRCCFSGALLLCCIALFLDYYRTGGRTAYALLFVSKYHYFSHLSYCKQDIKQKPLLNDLLKNDELYKEIFSANILNIIYNFFIFYN